MVCPKCQKNLKKAFFYNVDVDYCPKCLGVWFENDELSGAKDTADRNLVWLDIDLWKHKEKFKISAGKRMCPACRMPLYEVKYGTSRIVVDVCNLCQGIWLDRGEFTRIMKYLQKEGAYRALNDFSKNLAFEFWEIFSGPESFRKEILDFVTLLKIFNYKFATQFPNITRAIQTLPK